MLNWRRGDEVSLLRVYVHSAIYETYLVLLWVGSVCTGVVVSLRSMVDWRRGWGLSALVSVHSPICEM